MEYNCIHYKRGCKKLAPCCNKLVYCRICHDDDNNHVMDRHAVEKVLCKKCNHLQNVQQICEYCYNCMGNYFCAKCKFFDDTDRGQFHCDKCGICRVGGKDNYYHCDKCNTCISISLKDNHNCIENVMKDVCPICREDLFNSTDQVSILKCGHYMHEECMTFMLKTENATIASYRCPTCQKTIVDLSSYWQALDNEISHVPMPQEYINEKRKIICNDCRIETTAPFHVLGLKCQNIECGSYNTKNI